MNSLLDTYIKDKNLRAKIETAFIVSDYYYSKVKKCAKPTQPFPTLEEALRCNRLCNEYYQKVNTSIKLGIKIVNSTLTEDQIVEAWKFSKQ